GAVVADRVRQRQPSVDRVDNTGRRFEPAVVEPNPSAPGTSNHRLARIKRRPDTSEELSRIHGSSGARPLTSAGLGPVAFATIGWRGGGSSRRWLSTTAAETSL